MSMCEVMTLFPLTTRIVKAPADVESGKPADAAETLADVRCLFVSFGGLLSCNFVPSPPKYQNSRRLGPRKGSSSQIVGLCWGAGRAESGS